MKPTLFILALVRRMQAAGCSFALSLGLIVEAAHREVDERNAAADEATAIDARMASIQGKLEQALANDPPRLRREILGVVAEFHRRELALADGLRVQLPLPLNV